MAAVKISYLPDLTVTRGYRTLLLYPSFPDDVAWIITENWVLMDVYVYDHENINSDN